MVLSLWDCSLRVFSKCHCFFGHVMSLITLIECLKGHKSLGSFSASVFQKVQSVSDDLTRPPIELVLSSQRENILLLTD